MSTMLCKESPLKTNILEPLEILKNMECMNMLNDVTPGKNSKYEMLLTVSEQLSYIKESQRGRPY